MEHRQVEGIDAHNFPTNLLGHPLLAWMGDDYVQYIVTELLLRFQKQDPGTEMLGMKCEKAPQLLTSVHEPTGTVREVVAKFSLQILLQASDGRCWRLRGEAKFCAVGLDQPGSASTSVDFKIDSSEEVV